MNESRKKGNGTWVIYDQFHWLNPDHLVRIVKGTWEEALEQYRFYKDAFPYESLVDRYRIIQ